MSKKRIYILYTGGTLGMKKTERGFRPVANWFGEQLKQLPELHSADMPEFVLHEYSPLLDSSDILPAHWAKMAADIAAHYHEYDGFVVLHGTDTMAYTAAALHYLLAPKLTKPVIITGAQIPLSEPNSDAPANVRNALYAAAYAGLAQVGLLFHCHVLAGQYATKFRAQDLDSFISPNAQPLLSWAGTYLAQSDFNKPDLIAPEAPTSFLPKTFVPKKVAVLTFHPGMSFELVGQWLAQSWDCVILHSFGSGNIPQHPLLLAALTAAAKRGVKLINCTQCLEGEVQMKYASGYLMADMGVISAQNKTLEAALAWAHIEL